ncbi:MAG TPA: sulfite dehydrogenase [Burkholderiales bacterium]|nr:sulfite dehydrogenase [Burkholderiales bacterium]
MKHLLQGGDPADRTLEDRPGGLTRRAFLKHGAALSSGAAAMGIAQGAGAQALAGEPWERVYGAGFRGYGEPSRFEQPVQRHIGRPYGDLAPGSGAALAPIERLEGIITPSSLHNDRSHSGTPDIDPARHRLVVHGLVSQPLVFSVDALLRYPMTSRIYFLECSGNSNRNLVPQAAQVPAGAIHGNIACSEWTGVPLRVLLEEAGLQPQAKWLLAEGADSAHMSRSVPIEKALDDAMIALYQNGERLRPEQGYPVRLLLPGWEGNMSVKWLRRIKATEEPTYTKDETSKYTDPLPDGRAMQFTFEMGVKSVITKPSSTMTLPRPGFYEISGIAWSGAGRIRRVEVSADGGKTWANAALYGEERPKALVRFRLPWEWTGQAAILQSRATDEKGTVQPLRRDWLARYAPDNRFHNNSIVSWSVDADGSVKNVYA